ncbi:ethanolaminephosphotransferase 1 [Platysternon megacephalum]|uniref:Ethanolaminephosphotransferase 1 n=1 Tax=Platysternon megacephalum TaxID=55544 RepID=A0A4D9DMP1_9SAUR|nr:ethanolaminephosphotransferase 1 [Platysternon megacephalum]
MGTGWPRELGQDPQPFPSSAQGGVGGVRMVHPQGICSNPTSKGEGGSGWGRNSRKEEESRAIPRSPGNGPTLRWGREGSCLRNHPRGDLHMGAEGSRSIFIDQKKEVISHTHNPPADKQRSYFKKHFSSHYYNPESPSSLIPPSPPLHTARHLPSCRAPEGHSPPPPSLPVCMGWVQGRHLGLLSPPSGLCS